MREEPSAVLSPNQEPWSGCLSLSLIQSLRWPLVLGESRRPGH